MAERSFEKEMQSLRLGEGAEFRGEGILAVTKALLQSGVAYVGGYQGAPISHLMDVLADAEDILRELGVHFEASASEATAAAMLAASINYPRDWLERLLTYIGGRRRPQFGGAFNGGINEFPKFYSSINQLVATEMWYTGHRSRGQGVLVRKSGCACTCE
jgi:hypothetical protein